MAKSLSATLTQEEKIFIRDHYQELTIEQLAIVTGRGESSILKVARSFNLSKSNSGCFKKGLRPWNLRKKGTPSVGNMCKSQFKKGQLPHNTKHDGAITIRYDHVKDRSGRPYQWIRIGNAKWAMLHRHIWVQHNGPIPSKHLVIFIDGNSLNCVLSNLKLITMGENARRNYNPAKAQIAARSLSDKYVAGRLAGRRNKKLRNALILGAPELIELKRSQLNLNRIIKYERDNKA